MRERTTFVIDHRLASPRLATTRNAGRILVFESGRVVESGSFDELVSEGGCFVGLAQAQFMTTDETRREASGVVIIGRESRITYIKVCII